METNFFFSRDSEAAFGTQSATMGGSFWMFGAKMTETNGNKLFFLGIQRQRLAPKVQPWEAGFGPELDWEKLWRDQVSGAKMTETNRNKLVFSRDSEAAFGTQSATMGGSFWIRIRLGKAVAGPGVPTTSTTTMGLLGFGPPRVVCFCSSAATSALRSINARSTKQGSIGDDDFVWSSGTERAMFLCCNIPCLTRTSLAVGCAVLDLNSSIGLG